MSSTWRLDPAVAAGSLLLLIVSVIAPAAAQVPLQVPLLNPLSRYNNIAEASYRLSKCGELTPERKEWLLHLLELATRPLDWSDAQWQAYDEALMKNFERLPPDPKEKCADLVRGVDLERKTVPRAQ